MSPWLLVACGVYSRNSWSIPILCGQLRCAAVRNESVVLVCDVDVVSDFMLCLCATMSAVRLLLCRYGSHIPVYSASNALYRQPQSTYLLSSDYGQLRTTAAADPSSLFWTTRITVSGNSETLNLQIDTHHEMGWDERTHHLKGRD
jgi:hypothetical protein